MNGEYDHAFHTAHTDIVRQIRLLPFKHQYNAYKQYMTLKYPDAQTIQGSIGAPQDTHHLDQGMTDGINLVVNTTIATMLREITTDAPSTITGFHQQEAL